MCVLEKLKSPGPPSVLALFAPDHIFAGLINSELLPPGLLLPMGNTQYNITCLNYTKRRFFFSVVKGAPSVLYRDIYIKKDC